MKWSWWSLHRALEKLPEAESLDGGASAFGTIKSWDAHESRSVLRPKPASEGILHEVFHGVLLSGEIIPSRELGDKIDRLMPEDADRNEAETLAAEMVLFERLGLKGDVRELVEFAFDNLQLGWKDSDEVRLEVERLKTDTNVVLAVDRVMEMLGAPT